MLNIRSDNLLDSKINITKGCDRFTGALKLCISIHLVLVAGGLTNSWGGNWRSSYNFKKAPSFSKPSEHKLIRLAMFEPTTISGLHHNEAAKKRTIVWLVWTFITPADAVRLVTQHIVSIQKWSDYNKSLLCHVLISKRVHLYIIHH